MWDYNPPQNMPIKEWAYRSSHQVVAVSKPEKRRENHRIPNDGRTWVYTVEITLVDTLKIGFPPSTHFISAPFCQKGREEFVCEDEKYHTNLSHGVMFNTLPFKN